MKKLIEKTIYSNHKKRRFTWGDIKHIELQDNDIINTGWEEAYYSENESFDGYYYCYVSRMVEETDKEYQKRLDMEAVEKDRRRQFRYENYLKLKEEFETK